MGRSRSPDRRDRRRVDDRARDDDPRGRDREPRKRSRSRERERGADNKEKDRQRESVRSGEKDRRRRSRSREDRGRREDRERDSDRRKDDKNHDKKGDEEEEEDKSDTKKQPLSLEELLKKRQEQALAEAKPVFMTKAQREAAALAKLTEKADTERKRVEELRSGLRNDQSSWQRNSHESQQREVARRERQEEREREKELEGIKIQYLGEKKVKKRIIKPSDKFRFNFDWENSEDTSRDVNPLYNNPHEAALLFGRGLRAGIDRKEQKKQSVLHEKELLSKMKSSAGILETKEDKERSRMLMKKADDYEEKHFSKKLDVHWSEKKLEDMAERDWRIFKEDFNISLKGGKLPLPIRNWEEADLPKSLYKAIQKIGYTKPSPIQMASIPIGLCGRDVIGVAETGSGKTCAFVVPMLAYIRKQPPMDETNEAEGPYSLVMAPTRELAQQIEEETVKFAHFMDYRVVSVVGGQSIEEQGFKLRRGCEVVVATPGRLLDCLESRYTVLNQCNFVVLDEADRMIDMGFEPQVVGVLDAMPSSNLKPMDEEACLEASLSKTTYRTTYMFSATMPMTVERLARKYLRNPAVVNIGSAGKAADLVTQNVVMCKENQKPQMMEDFMRRKPAAETVICFVNAKKQCDYVSQLISSHGYSSTVLHGGKTQDQREASLKGFKDGTFNVLVATDVAGRGIDIPDVGHVVNFAMPADISQYTHRIGRTGRAGKKGTATTFLTTDDAGVFYDLRMFLTNSNQAVPAELARHEAAREKPDPFKKKRESTIFSKR
eukprot:CAMPEP_0198230128 /NCGR_PEP_ID=MMETSP1445-20131203/114493_1 /TAXON_ID=36898 /ORGANISM="Pyramimonas sp., Strain CCMP2087" /LENGTH=776 /DNA_ID=CAMNT_0043910635 /DNA_START=98 /DNA_END=2431 /DNA_ORIENTATION=+